MKKTLFALGLFLAPTIAFAKDAPARPKPPPPPPTVACYVDRSMGAVAVCIDADGKRSVIA